MTFGKKFVIGYMIFFAVIVFLAWKAGSFEISEICAVEGVGCPNK